MSPSISLPQAALPDATPDLELADLKVIGRRPAGDRGDLCIRNASLP